MNIELVAKKIWSELHKNGIQGKVTLKKDDFYVRFIIHWCSPGIVSVVYKIDGSKRKSSCYCGSHNDLLDNYRGLISKIS